MNKIYQNSSNEHLKFSEMAKFRCKMLQNTLLAV